MAPQSVNKLHGKVWGCNESDIRKPREIRVSFTKQSEDQIVKWIKADQQTDLGHYLVSGSIHGKPGLPVAELGRIENLIKKHLG